MGACRPARACSIVHARPRMPLHVCPCMPPHVYPCMPLHICLFMAIQCLCTEASTGASSLCMSAPACPCMSAFLWPSSACALRRARVPAAQAWHAQLAKQARVPAAQAWHAHLAKRARMPAAQAWHAQLVMRGQTCTGVQRQARTGMLGMRADAHRQANKDARAQAGIDDVHAATDMPGCAHESKHLVPTCKNCCCTNGPECVCVCTANAGMLLCTCPKYSTCRT